MIILIADKDAVNHILKNYTINKPYSNHGCADEGFQSGCFLMVNQA